MSKDEITRRARTCENDDCPQSPNTPVYACDMCKVQLCQKCGNLTASEVKVLELKKRAMTYNCINCVARIDKMKAELLNLKLENQKLKDMNAKRSNGESAAQQDNIVQIIADQVRKQINVELKPLQNELNELKTALSAKTKPTNHMKIPKHKEHKTNGSKGNQSPNILFKDQEKLMNEYIYLDRPTYSEVAETKPKTDNFNKERRTKFKSQIGSGSDDVECGFSGREKADKKIWLFISRAKDNVTDKTVKKYVSVKAEISEDRIYTKQLHMKSEVKDNNCFMVGVDPDLESKVYDTEFWPKGVAYSRFDFFLGKRFLDNSRSNTVRAKVGNASTKLDANF